MLPGTSSSQTVRSGSTIARESRWAFWRFPSGPAAWRSAAQIGARCISRRARLCTPSARELRGADSLPLDGGRRLSRNVVHHARNTLHLVDDAARADVEE